MAEIVRIETKSAWLSKINWTQFVGLAASVLVFTTGIDLPLEQQAQVVLAIQALQGIVTWVLKTWWTPTITPASASVSGMKTIKLD
jgi:hypothetical protein